MSDQPTLDGLTPAQLLSICEEAAVNALQAETVLRSIVLPQILTSTIRMAAYAGARAMFDELLRRGLIVDRP